MASALTKPVEIQQSGSAVLHGDLSMPAGADSVIVFAHGSGSSRHSPRNRQVAEAALRPWKPVFMHGDLQITHVFVDDDEITGVIDWSEAAQGDALYDLAILTLGHDEHLDEVVAGYGTDVDLDVIRGWWSWRSLVAARWLVEHGFDPSLPGCEFDVLRSRM